MRRVTWSFLSAALFVCAGCSSASADKAGFYSYVDAQGNVVTVSRDARGAAVAEPKIAVGADATKGDAAKIDTSKASASDDVAGSARYASNPNELWSLDDESYMTSDDFESEVTRKLRDRFVSYPDETGRVATYQVDMAAAQEVAEDRRGAAQDLGEDVLPEARVVTRWTNISADCCQMVLANAATLAAGEEKPVNVAARPRGGIDIEGWHPARAFRLDPSIKMIQLQSWKKKGYLYPQALFLDKDGTPLARVAQIFTRKKAQTWAAQPYLIGELPMEPGAEWLVLFLDYAQITEQGVISQDKSYLKFENEEMPLATRGELVVRATSGVF